MSQTHRLAAILAADVAGTFSTASEGFSVDLAEVAGAQAILTGGPRLPGQRGTSRPAGVAHAFFSAAGKELAIAGDINLEHLTSPLVPSSAVVIAITYTGLTSAHPVVAYRVIRAGAAEPVFAVEPPEGATLFQAVGTYGFVRLYDGALFPVAAAVAAVAAVVAAVAAAAPVAPVAPVVAAPVEVEIEPTPVMPKAVAGKRR